jgi:hypothetical protein
MDPNLTETSLETSELADGGQISDPSSSESRPSSPDTSSLSYDLGKSVYEGTHRAIQEALQVQAKPQARSDTYAEPAAAAMAAMDLREEILDDLLEVLAEAPKDVREEVRRNLRAFKSYEQLQVVKATDLHRTMADAAIGRAIRQGKYVPTKQAGGTGVSREPVHSEPLTRIPSDFRREQEEVCRILGVNLTEAELQAAWRGR